IEAGKWSGCESSGRFGQVSYFPILQYLPGLALKRLGAHEIDVARGLIWINGLAVLGMLALLVLLCRRRGASTATMALLLLVVLSGPLLWYAESGYSEALSAFLVLLAVTAVLLEWPPAAVAAGCLLAGITKETAPAFVLLA